MTERGALAVDGGKPVRQTPLPYARHQITEEDVDAVTQALRGESISRGPVVRAFEEALAARVGARFAVAYSSGTAALDGAAFAAGVRPGDRAVTSTLSFAASANGAAYHGAAVDLTDMAAADWNMDPEDRALDVPARVVVPVHFAGLPAPMDAIRRRAPGAVIIEDAAHALGAMDQGSPVGACRASDMVVFSFHPAKLITTLEGGAVTTNDEGTRDRLRRFRDHGMERRRELLEDDEGPWYFELQDLGRNYHLSDVQAALGLSQLRRLDGLLAARQALAAWYRRNLPSGDLFTACPEPAPGLTHAYHIFPVALHLDRLRVGRRAIFEALRAEGVHSQVHYLPIHRQPYYRSRLADASRERYPRAEAYYQSCLTLPLFPGMCDGDLGDVAAALEKVLEAYRA